MFTLVACLVVVGASAAAVLWQTLGGVQQPATEPPPSHGQSGPGHAPRPAPEPAPPANQGPPSSPRGVWRRLRAAVNLFVLVVLIGTLAAGAIGALAAVAAFAVREAVK